MFVEDFEIFKNLWVEQGDEISLEYSGTHALKRDLVRYGKQTMAGLIKDGMSALSRYYLKNFQDGVRQDAIDLISGRYDVNTSRASSSQLNGFETFSVIMWTKSLSHWPSDSKKDYLTCYQLCFCISHFANWRFDSDLYYTEPSGTKCTDDFVLCSLCVYNCWTDGSSQIKWKADLL